MKILHYIYDHIHNPWVGGGGAVRAVELGRRLALRGHEVTLVSGRYPGAVDYESDGVRYRFVGSVSNNYMLSTFCYAARAFGHLRRHAQEADVVVEDFAPYNPIFAYRLSSKKPVVLQVQNYLGSEILKKYWLAGLPFWLVERKYPGKFSNHIVMVESLKERLNIQGNVQTISNGIDEGYLKEPIMPGHYVLFMGRLERHQKGLDVLSRAMSKTYGKFVIAGDGKDRDRFLSNCTEESCKYVGYVRGERKREVLRDASLAVFPSRYEGQNIVVLEAAAFGKPVVVSDIPELGYAVEAGFGISFRSGDADDLAEKINRLHSDEALRARMSVRGREYAKNYTWDKIADMYESFFLELTNSEVTSR